MMSQYQETEKPKKTVGHIQEPWKEITFLWKIYNFTKLSQEDCSLKSPKFSSAEYKWYLELYPNGEEHLSQGWFGLYTQQCGGQEVNSTFEAGIQNAFGRIEFEKKEDDFEFIGISKFLHRRALLDRRDEFLPEDTLTIWIRHKHDDPCSRALTKNALRRERRLETLRSYKKYKNELSLPGANKRSVWEKMASSVRSKYSMSKTDYGSEKFHSQMLSLKREYELHRNKSSVTSPYVAMFLKEAQLAFDGDSEIPESYEDINSQIQGSKTLSKEEKTPAKHDTGPLFSAQATTSQRKPEEENEISTDFTQLSDHFGKLLLDEECSDVTIDVKGKIIKTHKAVLKVRSEGLFSMLKNNSPEGENLVIKIEDCEPEAFEIFLHYLYTGKVENLSATKLFDLYDIALKFNSPHLKAECEKHMIRSDS